MELGETDMAAREPNNWDRRYDQEAYYYGLEPNHFIGPQLAALPPGRGLFLAEGEGRNAVYAAGLGHQVIAVDSSYVGQEKTLKFAAERGVTVDYRLADLVAESWPDGPFDFVVLCFAHLPPEAMPEVHARAVACLRPGGRLVHCSFSQAQFGRKSGGPPRLDWLHELELLKKQYAGLDLDHALEREVDLDEAEGHRGPAMVIELSGNKPEAGSGPRQNNG
jgi:SAM-dependent methyltransferase